MKKKASRFNLDILPDSDDTIRVCEDLARKLGRPPTFEELKNNMKRMLIGKILGVDMKIDGDKLDTLSINMV